MIKTVSAINIEKSFGSKRVLCGVNIEAEMGKITGLLGPSGAGKTTLIKIFTGQLEADSGICRIKGKDIGALKKEEKRRFGIMADELGVYDRLSCYENLRIFARLYGLSKEDIQNALKNVGLENDGKTRADKLSKGMRCRLRLARALMIRPEILFLDEPTSGLDPTAAEKIHRLILDECARGTAVLLTTHNMAEAQKLCSSVSLLCDGRIVESGAPDDICRRHNSSRILRIHLSDGRDIELSQNEGAAESVAELIRTGKADSIHTSEPDLDAVFKELTGKELAI